MKYYFTLIGLVLYFSSTLQAQIFPESAYVNPQTNDLGDPISNGMDANGSLQGPWYYQTTDGQIRALQIFTDNELLSTSICLDDNQHWINLAEVNTNQAQVDALKNSIVAQFDAISLDNSKLIFIYKSEQGEWTIHLFGNYDHPTLVKSTILTFLNAQSIQNNFYGFIQ
jgi:hypothetical protein